MYRTGSSTDTIWYTWASPSTTAITSHTHTIWAGWMDTMSQTATTSSIYTLQTNTETAWSNWNTINIVQHKRVEPTAEERAAAVARDVAARERHQAALELAKQAEARAEQLLVENLSLKQRVEYLEHKHFTVHGRGARFRIRKGRNGNIDVVNAEGILTHRLCGHPGIMVPDFDTMLAQKLALETDEDAFIKVANKHVAPSSGLVVMPPMRMQ